MATDALKSLFALLEMDEDDFATLIRRFGINPATDLQNCDLTNVDFGRLTVDTLDLTGSDISGADLSKIKCKKLIGVAEASSKHTTEKSGSIDEVVLAVSRYQNADWSLNQIISAVSERAAPVLAFYNTAAEQDLLTKRVCAHFGDASHLREGFNAHASGLKLLWFYSKAAKAPIKLNPATLDKAFFEILSSRNRSDDIGIYPFRANQASVDRIRDSVHSGTSEEMREAFIHALRRELAARTLKQALFLNSNSIVVFSGFPPISKRFYLEMREQTSARFIFLCSSNWEPSYLQDGGRPWRRVAAPGYSIGVPLAIEEDVRRLVRRIEMASRGTITVSNDARQWMDDFVGEPLAALKQQIIFELRNSFSARGTGIFGPLTARKVATAIVKASDYD